MASVDSPPKRKTTIRRITINLDALHEIIQYITTTAFSVITISWFTIIILVFLYQSIQDPGDQNVNLLNTQMAVVYAIISAAITYTFKQSRNRK